MRVEIENGNIAASMEILYNLSLVGTQSRHRTRVLQTLEEHLTQVRSEYGILLKEHCGLKANDPKEVTEQDVLDYSAFSQDIRELYSEKYVLEGSNLTEALRTIK